MGSGEGERGGGAGRGRARSPPALSPSHICEPRRQHPRAPGIDASPQPTSPQWRKGVPGTPAACLPPRQPAPPRARPATSVKGARPPDGRRVRKKKNQLAMAAPGGGRRAPLAPPVPPMLPNLHAWPLAEKALLREASLTSSGDLLAGPAVGGAAAAGALVTPAHALHPTTAEAATLAMADLRVQLSTVEGVADELAGRLQQAAEGAQ